jgi:hypothetical protein
MGMFPSFATRGSCGLAFALCAGFVLTGCTKPKVPDQELPPDPQAAAPTSLNESIQQPIDEAKAVREATEAAANTQREAIDAATSE